MRGQIAALERLEWPDAGGGGAFPSAPGTYDSSFVLMENGAAVCHVGIRRCAMCHRGQSYLAYGLSEVVTHPGHRGLGLASKLVRSAAKYIVSQPADVSIFTCRPELVSFYERGGWEPLRGACLVGGTREKPFRSDTLGLTVMARFLSEKGKLHRAGFEGADLVLELGEGELW